MSQSNESRERNRRQRERLEKALQQFNDRWLRKKLKGEKQ